MKEWLEYDWIEIIGYTASALIVFSFMLSNVRLLRFISTLGCIMFIIYGALIHSMPIIVANGAIALLNTFYLFFSKSKKREPKENTEKAKGNTEQKEEENNTHSL